MPAMLLLPAMAQSFEAETRAQQIHAQQVAKSEHLEPDQPDRLERTFDRIEDIVDRIYGASGGIRPVVGGMATGSGFAVGAEYFRPDLATGNVVFRTSVRGSTRRYTLIDAQLTFPSLFGDHAFADLLAVHRNFPMMNYYGPGPDSLRSQRTTYRLEDASFDGTFGVRGGRYLRAGFTAGYLMANVGPGTDRRFASTEDVFTPLEAVGVDRQTNFLRGGPFIQFDYRDRPLNPHRGGNYVVSYIYYDDRKLNAHSHKKLTGEAQQYIPFFNEKRVIALRAKTELSYRNPNQQIPFYVQPVLGGSDDLRGFRQFRFHDNNLMLMNAEYRWEVNTGLDMALFADAGKVFRRHANLNFKDLESAAGFGFRFKSRHSVFMRWDVAFSHEGVQVWFKFNNVF
jgi:outer membrane protein assembly factor BamA